MPCGVSGGHIQSRACGTSGECLVGDDNAAFQQHFLYLA
jgi:hypothetical protein